MTTKKQKFVKALQSLGHHPVEKPWDDVFKDNVFPDNSLFVCNNCGTIFTTSGGQWGGNNMFVKDILYWGGNMVGWKYYPKDTCKDFIIRNIIQ